MPHSSGFARLASGAFYFAIQILTFYEIINTCSSLFCKLSLSAMGFEGWVND
jgi:hypothetical protein